MENIADDEDLIRFALEIPIDSDDESGESDDECFIDYDPIVDNNYSQNDFIEQAPSTITANGLEDLIPLINSEALTSPEQPRRQNRQTQTSKTAPNNIQIQPPVVSYKDINWKKGNLILNKNVTEFLGNSNEQICPTKARSYLKQYLPLKPHKWGYKIFVLSGVSGFSYNFEVYSGLENNPDQRLQNEPHLGASANIVVRLARIIPKNQNYKLYFDNYYTTLALEVYLKKNGIYSLGTLRRNRVPGLILPDEKYLKTKPRGFSSECLAEVDGEAVTVVIWKDNKYVTLLSTLSGKLPETEVKRFDKKNKIRSIVPCPNIVGVYNKHMGGVDLLDAHIARYRVGMRSKKWYFKIFYHFFDVAMVNAWILYKKVNSDEKYMPLKDFRQEIAVSLCKIGENLTPTRGRKRKEPEQSEKKKRGYQTFKPPRDVRLDMIAHFPKITDKRERCKNNGCGKKTSIMCRKCKVYLCLNKTNDCFYDYHCPQ
ncbi:piggyBac transposable element-derived protein 3-like [Rhopalosiphum padi]|uniref:piggyBac transposable element-derived protein 3-like n=1 Tax=Rhopalosiphum padi TaxID=40932 RepID=UPI00298ED0BF|nr:piggyBac transposable element-derived protein 3-like [Rhopalosiphum padi]